jgi:glucosamine 6-phosphate synthetase-like amidotransferase/phosphosugar isomerase protein
MCGIGGLIKTNELNNQWVGEILHTLALGLASRGEDATGVYTSEGAGVIRKAPGAAKKFNDWPQHFGKVTFVHTRQGTGGDPKDNRNNHPLYGDRFVLVHNGCVPKMEKLEGYNYQGECDSEVLLSYLETKGIIEGIKALKGSAAFVVCDKYHPTKVWFYAWKNPLNLAVVHGYGIFFASTSDILRATLRSKFKLSKGLFLPAYTTTMSDGDLLELDLATMEFTKSKVEPTAKETVVYWNRDEYDAVDYWRHGEAEKVKGQWAKDEKGNLIYKGGKSEKGKAKQGDLVLVGSGSTAPTDDRGLASSFVRADKLPCKCGTNIPVGYVNNRAASVTCPTCARLWVKELNSGFWYKTVTVQ